MSKRYQILGINKMRKEQEASTLQALVKQSLELHGSRYRGLGNYPPEKSQLLMRGRDIRYCYELATFKHLQLDIGSIDIEEYLEEGARVAVDYFYGDYLKKNRDAAYAMKKSPRNNDLSWFSVYRYGLFLSFLSQDVESEHKLIDWIEPSLPFDESMHLVTAQDNDYHKLLAEFIEHDELITKKLVASIQKCRKQRPKLLLACLTALQKRDDKGFVSNLKKFLDYYFKREFGEEGIDSYFSIEASILWFLAEWLDLVPAGLTEKQSALIMTRETLGLRK